jgi:tetratricopeptide (TPR) repeat protein
VHVPGWHEATKELQDAGDLQMVGIIQEQHPDRARLFMQWKEMGWPILIDSLDLLETTVVPMTLLIDEHGVIRQIQPPRDRLDELRAGFLDIAFEAPDATADSSLPDMSDEAAEAVSAYLWDSVVDPNAVVGVFERAVDADPEHGYTLFRTGVAYRWRYDSDAVRTGDFQRAVHYWERALSVDPNNYIWRRRIQQYGPRLAKPYSFYDWVATARREITERGGEPSPLVVEPGGAEFAQPQRTFTADEASLEPPEVDDRIYRDSGEYVEVEATVVPRAIAPGASTRAHVSFIPNEAIKAHWNNEVDDLIFWVEVPAGWQLDRRAVTVPNPPETVSNETRKVELEIKAPDDASGRYELPGYALYYVCEDVNGICLYRRQDVSLVVEVAR